MGQPLFDRVKVQLDRGVAEVWAYHKASVDHRMFILKCKSCNEMSAVRYRPFNNAEVHAGIIQGFEFLKLEGPSLSRMLHWSDR